MNNTYFAKGILSLYKEGDIEEITKEIILFDNYYKNIFNEDKKFNSKLTYVDFLKDYFYDDYIIIDNKIYKIILEYNVDDFNEKFNAKMLNKDNIEFDLIYNECIDSLHSAITKSVKSLSN